MRSLTSRMTLAGLVASAMTLGGCATVGSVKRAQGSADQAGSAAQRAQSSADAAGSAAQSAGTAAARAQAAAEAAGGTAQAAGNAAQLAGVEARDASGRIVALSRRVDYLMKHRRHAKRHRAVHHARAAAKAPPAR